MMSKDALTKKVVDRGLLLNAGSASKMTRRKWNLTSASGVDEIFMESHLRGLELKSQIPNIGY